MASSLQIVASVTTTALRLAPGSAGRGHQLAPGSADRCRVTGTDRARQHSHQVAPVVATSSHQAARIGAGSPAQI
ncbi:hypothetical protein, partial [Rhodoferax sp.]|uniref:hypothetical protein n=1 Tax=Rhodoferax sp. TaxID=50421 RepID=UPI0026030F28